MRNIKIPFEASLKGLEERYPGRDIVFKIGLHSEQKIFVPNPVYSPPSELVIRIGGQSIAYADYLKDLLDNVRAGNAVDFNGDYLYSEGLPLPFSFTAILGSRFNREKYTEVMEETVPKGLVGKLNIKDGNSYEIKYKRDPVFYDYSTFDIKPARQKQFAF